MVTELQLSGDTSILEKLNVYINQLLDIAKSRELYYLIIDIYILQSKIFVVNFEVEKAKDYLNKAKEISEQAELGEFRLKIDEEKKHLELKIDSWKKMIKTETTVLEKNEIIERSKEMKINDTLNSMKSEIITKLFVLRL